MAGLTETLQIALVTEEPFNVGVEVNKAYVWVNNRNAVIHLYLSGWEVFLALVAFIMLCKSPSLHIDFLLCLCLFQRFIASGVFAG
jgi:succinate-acetate transporter protein